MIPQRLYSGQKVKMLDKRSIEGFKIPPFELMSRAGLAAFNVIRQRWPLCKRFAIVCGTGNNGGDGFVVARLLYEDGFHVDVYSVDPTCAMAATADLARNEFLATGQIVRPLPERIEDADLIVDAVLGTGVRAPLKPEWADAIGLINRSSLPVLSLDMPSGLDADSGAVIDQAVNADCTITFLGLKYALLTGKALNYSGQVLFTSLGAPEEVYEEISWDGEILDLSETLSVLKPRKPASHKGDFGHVVVVGGGTAGLRGAPVLAGLSALHSGAGRVSAIVDPKVLPLLNAPLELMCHTEDHFDALYKAATVLVVGPGLTQSPWAKTQWEKALSTNKPMVVDADALRLLALSPKKNDHWILTPHPGEAAALLGVSVDAIEAHRVEAVKQIQAKFGGIVVLKGAGSLIQGHQDQFYLCTAGNPGMATAGMGDVLSGIIASLLAQGLQPMDATKLGVMIHANAADVELALGERGMLASDLMLHIRNLLNPIQSDEQPNDFSEFFNLQ